MGMYYAPYTEFHEQVKNAVICIGANPCSNLLSEVSNIKSKIFGIGVPAWKDSAGTEFKNNLLLCKIKLNLIEGSIQSVFTASEGVYKDLDKQLDDLKTADNSWTELLTKEPQQDDYKITIEKKDPENGKTISSYKKPDYAGWKIAHDDWDNSKRQFEDYCSKAISNIETYKSVLDDMNNCSISATSNVKYMDFKIQGIIEITMPGAWSYSSTPITYTMQDRLGVYAPPEGIETLPLSPEIITTADELKSKIQAEIIAMYEDKGGITDDELGRKALEALYEALENNGVYELDGQIFRVDEETIARIKENGSNATGVTTSGTPVETGGADGYTYSSREAAIEILMSHGWSREDAESYVDGEIKSGRIKIDNTVAQSQNTPSTPVESGNPVPEVEALSDDIVYLEDNPYSFEDALDRSEVTNKDALRDQLERTGEVYLDGKTYRLSRSEESGTAATSSGTPAGATASSGTPAGATTSSGTPAGTPEETFPQDQRDVLNYDDLFKYIEGQYRVGNSNVPSSELNPEITKTINDAYFNNGKYTIGGVEYTLDEETMRRVSDSIE